MLCEICHGSVLTVAEERNPVEVEERKPDGSTRRYTVRCCERCAQDLAARQALKGPPAGTRA